MYSEEKNCHVIFDYGQSVVTPFGSVLFIWSSVVCLYTISTKNIPSIYHKILLYMHLPLYIASSWMLLIDTRGLFPLISFNLYFTATLLANHIPYAAWTYPLFLWTSLIGFFVQNAKDDFFSVEGLNSTVAECVSVSGAITTFASLMLHIASSKHIYRKPFMKKYLPGNYFAHEHKIAYNS